VQRWVFSGALGNLNLPSLPLSQIAGAIGASIKPILAVVGLAVVVGGIVFLSKRWKNPAWITRWQRLGFSQRDPSRRAIFAAYRRAQRQLKSYRGEAQTVGEHAQVAPELGELASLVEIAAYRPEPPDAEMIKRAKGWKKKEKI